MNKAEFLAGLRDALAGKAPVRESWRTCCPIMREYFADAGEEHEAEAAEGLGSPASVAAQVLEGRTGQAPSAASAERRPRRLWPVVLGICAAALLLLGVGIRLVFLWPSADARRRTGGRGTAAGCGRNRSLRWWSRTRFPHRRKTSWSWSPLPRWTSMWALVISAWRRGTAGI
ncbi:MAG: hypothetical protein ACLRWQ_19605 [Flavonifractor plautii]